MNGKPAVKPTREELENAAKESSSFFECLKRLGRPQNGAYHTRIKKWLSEESIDVSHFGRKAYLEKVRKYPILEKQCPVCGTTFTVKSGQPKEKVTCSYSCSNKHFVAARNKPENHRNYRTICFFNWKKECVVCGFDNVVEAHHLDHDHSNNDKHNLVPLCPNHHQMLHTKKWAEQTRKEVLEKIKDR